MSEPAANPFSRWGVLALILFGAGVFLAFLYMLGSGMTGGSTNDGGNHVGGKGLNGYAALANLVEKRGHVVRRTRDEGALDDGGLLILTPPHFMDPDKLGQLLSQRRYAGPTILIMPKWHASQVPVNLQPKGSGHEGWVMLGGASSPGWGNRIPGVDGLDLRIDQAQGYGARWQGMGRSGPLAEPRALQSLSSGRIVPLVRGGGNAQPLAGYHYGNGGNAKLDKAAGVRSEDDDYDGGYPLLIVAEPDLMNNYGMADRERALLAVAMVEAAMGDEELPVSFDLTMNGFARSTNLLTLAFTPPFLAATLCFLIAALVVGWRAFLRFGPARRAERAIAFGKGALVSNAAGLIRRSGRLHLIAAPYAEHARERLARVLALPRTADADATEAAIDRALAGRHGDAKPFSAVAARLRAARRPNEILKAAHEVHLLEKVLRR